MPQPTAISQLVTVLRRGGAVQGTPTSTWDQAQIEGLLVQILAPYFAAAASPPTPPTVAPNP